MRCFFTLPILAAGLLLGGCSKPDKGNTQGAMTAAVESGPVVPELGSTEASSWVNGAPITFASARGSVVLVETWDRF